MLAAYREAKDLIEIGAYITGSNALVDRAVRQKEEIDQFLCQDITEITHSTESWAALADVLANDVAPEVVPA
jgi:flagellum-specific ATP synthase